MTPLQPSLGQGVADLLDARARSTPDKVFLTWAPFEGASRTWTYGEFTDDVARVAGGLAGRGVAPGDRIVTLLDNCPEALLTWFACAWLGAVCVPVNASSTARELSSFVERTNAIGVVTQPRLSAVVAACDPAPSWAVITETDAGAPSLSSPVITHAFASLYGAPIASAAVDPMAPVSILFTSGTTAAPKGVVWTHANAVWGAKIGALQEGLREDDVHLVFLPLFHVVALSWSILATIWAGASAVLQPRFSAGRFWETAIAYRCTWASLVPFCTAVLAKQTVPATHHFRMWGHAVYAPHYERLFGVKLLGWWGMTEVITQGLIGDAALAQAEGTIGRPSAAYEVRIVDEQGAPTRSDEPGELRIRGVPGVSIFLEYLDDPAATREAFDADGYFRTGDRVVLHDGGCIRFVDRAKDVIKVGGENVSAPEVERIIAGIAGVREAAVVAKKDAVFGEVPVAFVILDEPAEASEVNAMSDRIMAVCSEQLARFKLPREVRVVSEFPRVAIGKVSKAELRKRLID